MFRDHDIIVAPATAPGGAIAVVRLSGRGACALCDRFFRGAAPLAQAAGYTVRFGRIADGERIVDEVLATVFRAPRSYTGEEAVEISCHGSSYIVSEILRLAREAGARMAEPGEFTLRAYLAGKLDLSQAEAVADLVASSSQAAHALAFNQMRGSVKTALERLREKLLRLASLLELELDFGEEEVEFADRSELESTMLRIGEEIDGLRASFALGNAIKEGVPVVIAGAPNVGKSTLLNRLLGDDRALVSDIAGTTRDVIEEQTDIDGVRFRFLDTAGIHDTDDRLERLGIERTRAAIERARIVIRLVDARDAVAGTIPAPDFTLRPDQTLLTVINKIDTVPGFSPTNMPAVRSGAPATASPAPGGSTPDTSSQNDTPAASLPSSDGFAPGNSSDTNPAFSSPNGALQAASSTTGNGVLPSNDLLAISARDGIGIEALRRALRSRIDTSALFHGGTVLSNERHLQALSETRTALDRAIAGFRAGISSDLLAEDVRAVISALSSISGNGPITSDNILNNIFSKFCIGK